MKLRNKMLWAGCLVWLVGISQICAQDYPASPLGKEGAYSGAYPFTFR